MSIQVAYTEANLIQYTYEFVFGSYVYRVKTTKSANARKVLVFRTGNILDPFWHHGVMTQKLTAEGFKPVISELDTLIFERDQDAINHMSKMNLE